MSKKVLTNVQHHSQAVGTSGYQFTNGFNSTLTPVANPGTGVMTVDSAGNVIYSNIPAWAALITLTDGTNSQVLSTGDTLTVTAGNGITATVSATDIVTLVAKLSTDAGNDIVFGSDGGLFFSANNLVTGASWNDATNTLVLTFDSGATANVPFVDVVSSFLSDFTISDGTNTDVVNNHETLTFAGADKIRPVVTANTVTYDLDTTGALAGQALSFDGTNVVWDNPVADRYIDTQTYVANTAITHTHGLATTHPQVQVFDSTGAEVVAEIVRTSATQFTVTVTLAGDYTVVAI